MKILYFFYTEAPGALVHITQFVKAFKDIEPSFKVFNPSLHDQAVSFSSAQPEKHPVKKRRSRVLAWWGHDLKSLLLNFVLFFRELRILNREKPDIILVRIEGYNFSLMLLARIKHIPIIIESNGPVDTDTKLLDKEHLHFFFLLRAIDRITLRSCQAVIAVSGVLKSLLIKRYKLDPNNIFVNHNGAEPDKLDKRSHFSDPELERKINNRPVIGFVGSFQPWHGIRELVKYFSEVTKSRSNAFLLLVGDGPEKNAVLHYIKEHKLESHTSVTGHIPHENISSYIALMDICVLFHSGSYSYGSPLKVFEYMAMGKAVIAPENGPLKEIISHNVDGLLVKEDAAAFKEAMTDLIENKEIRDSLGRKAREKILKNFTWKKNAERVLSVCSSVYQKTQHEK